MPQLDAYQSKRTDQARDILARAEVSGPDTWSMAVTIGQLQWAVSDLLSLVDQLAGIEA